MTTVKKRFRRSFLPGTAAGGSDSWRLSSGITEVEELEDSYIINNESGSVYTCYKGRYGMSAYAMGILESFKKQAPITMVEKYDHTL